MAKKSVVPLKELNLTDRFLFDEVMEDPLAHQAALNIIFGKEISLLMQNQTEKEKRLSPTIRSIRMDVYAMDQEKIIYNTEMQEERKTDLAKRSRYYQALIDTGLLEPGIPNYNLLNDSFIIIITPFDLFGFGKYVYTFDARCREVPDCILKDGAVRIFLNTRGTNDEDISEELRTFLYYIENTTEEAIRTTDSKNLKKLHERVCKVKTNEEVGVKYMQAWEEKYYDREEGIEIGMRRQLTELVEKKLKKGKSVEVIADEVEESIETVEEIIAEIMSREE